jgi:hypothetical protein
VRVHRAILTRSAGSFSIAFPSFAVESRLKQTRWRYHSGSTTSCRAWMSGSDHIKGKKAVTDLPRFADKG